MYHLCVDHFTVSRLHDSSKLASTKRYSNRSKCHSSYFWVVTANIDPASINHHQKKTVSRCLYIRIENLMQCEDLLSKAFVNIILSIWQHVISFRSFYFCLSNVDSMSTFSEIAWNSYFDWHITCIIHVWLVSKFYL